METGELNVEELRLELHGEWSEFADECVGLKSTVEIFRGNPHRITRADHR
jgi:hypothetical protein